MKTVFQFGGNNPFKGAKTSAYIQLDQNESRDKRFTVTYGLQQDKNLTYSQACSKLGEALLHHACCEGLADNDGGTNLNG